MSYILDALKKAERERRLAHAPRGEALDASARRGRPRLRPWALGAALLLAAGALVWLLRPEPVAVTTERAVTAPAPIVAPPAAPPPIPAPARREAPRRDPPPPAMVASRPAPQPSRPPDTPPEPAAAPPAALPVAPAPAKRAAAPPPDKPAEATAAATPAPAPPAPARPEPIPEKSPAPTAPATPAPAPLAATPPPAPTPRPAPLPARVPATVARPPAEGGLKLKLEVLVYSDRDAERLVFINGRKYVEGQEVEGRFRLEAITPEGAILIDEGRRFLLPP